MLVNASILKRKPKILLSVFLSISLCFWHSTHRTAYVPREPQMLKCVLLSLSLSQTLYQLQKQQQSTLLQIEQALSRIAVLKPQLLEAAVQSYYVYAMFSTHSVQKSFCVCVCEKHRHTHLIIYSHQKIKQTCVHKCAHTCTLMDIFAIISGLREKQPQQMSNILKCSQSYNPCENEIVSLLTTHYSATHCFSVGCRQSDPSKFTRPSCDPTAGQRLCFKVRCYKFLSH